MRPMGLLDKELSPVSVASIGREAMSPASNRMVVPLLPQSRGTEGEFHSAAGLMRTCSGTIDATFMPSALRMRKVVSQSADRSGFLTTESPFEIDASM